MAIRASIVPSKQTRNQRNSLAVPYSTNERWEIGINSQINIDPKSLMNKLIQEKERTQWQHWSICEQQRRLQPKQTDKLLLITAFTVLSTDTLSRCFFFRVETILFIDQLSSTVAFLISWIWLEYGFLIFWIQDFWGPQCRFFEGFGKNEDETNFLTLIPSSIV